MALLKLSDRELSDSEMVIHRLYEITSHYEAGLRQQTRELPEVGWVRFEMEVGTLSRVEGETYEIIESVAPGGVAISAGDRLGFGAGRPRIDCGTGGPPLV